MQRRRSISNGNTKNSRWRPRSLDDGELGHFMLLGTYKQTTTATATRTPQNKRFNEQNNSCARAL